MKTEWSMINYNQKIKTFNLNHGKLTENLNNVIECF